MLNAIYRLGLFVLFLYSTSFSQDSVKVAIFYYSQSGHTLAMAEAVKEGVVSIDGVVVRLISVEKFDLSDLLEADAIIVGSPVHKGNIAMPVLQFINTWPFEGAPLKDKIGAAFVSAGGISAGEELVQMNILQAMLINRMIIVGGPKWQGAFGASAVTGEEPFATKESSAAVNPLFLEKARALGKRVAEITKKFKADEIYTFKPDNPLSANWLKQHLSSSAPRLILTGEVEKKVRDKLNTDELVKSYYDYIKNKGGQYLDARPLERKKIGKRMLSISREAVARISTLALLYRIEKDENYLKCLESEINNVCDFQDWNPSHFLDVAEMAFAVSIGIDWCGAYLKNETVSKAKKALKEKALVTSIKDPPYGWITSEHNWNQVCHGGLSAAAIVLAEDEPELAARILSRTLDGLPYALVSYAPDGAFPEGPGYWFYATYYTTIMIAMFESAFDTDFNLTHAPGFLESARYSLLTIGPSGDFYNYFDGGPEGAFSLQHLGILNWFEQKDTGYAYYDRELYFSALQKARLAETGYDRFSAITLIWLTGVKESLAKEPLPNCWIGNGPNPLAIIRSPNQGGSDFYLAAKGGRASLNHGNMDGGSFIFELNGIRWSIDPGNQSYSALEKIMGENLWRRGQDSERWSLLTKNNFGHSSLTVNKALHDVEGFVPIVKERCDLSSPRVSFDLSKLFFGNLDNAQRTFVKKNERTLVITDEIRTNEETKSITWAMMTKADVKLSPDGVRLRQNQQQLDLHVRSPIKFDIQVIDLDPPPLSYDKKIENLKRIEIHVNPAAFKNSQVEITVELSGE